VEICYFTGPMGHPRVEIHTRPRPGLLWVRVWMHPRVRCDTHTRTQWVWHPRAPAPTGRTAIPTAEQYLAYKLIDSNADWKARWFYVTNHHPGLPKPSGRQPKHRDWWNT
jgi:hypothetical protein